MNTNAKKDKSVWGHTVAWYPEYTENRGENEFEAKLNFLQEYGLKAFTTSFNALDNMDSEEKENLFAMLEERDMFIAPHLGFGDLTASREEIDESIEKVLEQIERYIEPLRTRIVTATLGKSHRYDRVMPFPEKVEKFSYYFKPLAKLCQKKGAPLALENHADYYCSEIAEIVKATPDLFILLDTANALHIGEQSVKAARDAAPYTIGTHFKDHYMVKETPPLHYEIRGCALGDGDAELEKVYQILKEYSPYKNQLVQLIELFKPSNMTAMECWNKSIDFIKGLRRKYDE